MEATLVTAAHRRLFVKRIQKLRTIERHRAVFVKSAMLRGELP